MEIKRGIYKNKSTGQLAVLLDIGQWQDGTRAIAIYKTGPFDIPLCCYLNTFKENYIFISEEHDDEK